MARRKSPNRSKPGAPASARTTRATVVKRPVAAMPGDFRAGLAFWVVLELVTYIALGAAEVPWLTEAKLALWRNLFLASTALLLIGCAGLWIVAPRTTRRGWLMLASIVWLVLLLVRMCILFVMAMAVAPVLLTLFVGQLAFGLTVPAAAWQRGRLAAQG